MTLLPDGGDDVTDDGDADDAIPITLTVDELKAIARGGSIPVTVEGDVIDRNPTFLIEKE